MDKKEVYLRFPPETFEEALKCHERPFYSIQEAVNEADSFNPPDRIYQVFRLANGNSQYCHVLHGQTK